VNNMLHVKKMYLFLKIYGKLFILLLLCICWWNYLVSKKTV